jgi:transposase
LDVHRDTVKACVRVPGPNGERRKEVKTFSTMTGQLLALRDWMKAQGVTHVAMESTGHYWKPVYYTLEEDFTVLLVNAAHIKNVPGRKTDVLDSEWIAELLECGLLRGSFVPPKPIRELRDLTRYRTKQIQERTREVQRLHNVLQDAGIKLSSVASDIMGVSGRLMIESLLEGKADADALADLARGRLRAKLPALRQALVGRFRDHHTFLVTQMLAHIDFIEEALGQLTQRIEALMRPFAEATQPLRTMPPLKSKTIQTVVAEIGVDMTKFPSADHLASWAGLCPGNNESAGKHKSERTRRGDRWLRTALVEAAQVAVKMKDSYFAALYRRIAPRRGHKRAIIAVAHAMLVTIYHLLSRKQPYQDLGGDYFLRLNRNTKTRNCVHQLEAMGYKVTLEPLVA